MTEITAPRVSFRNPRIAWSAAARTAATEDPLEELAGLAETAGTQVVGVVTQRPKPGRDYLPRQGQSQRTQGDGEATEADVILFDNDFSPAQTRNLEQATGVKCSIGAS